VFSSRGPWASAIVDAAQKGSVTPPQIAEVQKFWERVRKINDPGNIPPGLRNSDFVLGVPRDVPSTKASSNDHALATDRKT
jgi:hypothetical protein